MKTREENVHAQYLLYKENLQTDGYVPLSEKDFKAAWDAYSIDRSQGRIRGHLSIRSRIEYFSKHKVAASVARRRSKQMKQLYNIDVNPEAAKDMDRDSWNALLQAAGIDPLKFYHELKKTMDAANARHIVSQVLYGSL